MITNNDPSPLSNSVATESPDISEPSYIQRPPNVFTPNDPPWGIGRALLAWFLSVVCLVLVPVVLLIPYIVYLAMTSGVPVGEAITQDKTLLLLSIIAVIPAHLLTLTIIWPIVTHWGRYPFWSSFGFSWPRPLNAWTGIGLSILVSLLLLLIGFGITNLVGGGKTELDILIESSYQARIAVAFLAFATAPLVEEVTYRGVLYPTLQRVLGMGWAIAIVSLLFAGVHVLQYHNNLGVIMVITLLSITLTVIRAWTGRLLPSIVVHLVFNGIQSLILVLEPLIKKSESLPPSAPAFTHLYLILRNLLLGYVI